MQEPQDSRQHPPLRNARLARAESAWLRSSLRSSPWCTFGYVLVSKIHLFPRWCSAASLLAPTNIIFSLGVRGGVTSEYPLSVSQPEAENSTETGEIPITVFRCPSSRKR